MTRIEVPNATAAGRPRPLRSMADDLAAAGHRRHGPVDLAHAVVGLCGRRTGRRAAKIRAARLALQDPGRRNCAVLRRQPLHGHGHIAPTVGLQRARPERLRADLSKAVGHRVQLHYTEHPGIPTNCFGDTRYFVDRVTITDNEPGAIPGAEAPNARRLLRPRLLQPRLHRRPRRLQRPARIRQAPRKIAAASSPPARRCSPRSAAPAARPRRSPEAPNRSPRTRERQRFHP